MAFHVALDEFHSRVLSVMNLERVNCEETAWWFDKWSQCHYAEVLQSKLAAL